MLRSDFNYDKIEANEMMDRVLKISPNILNSVYNAGVRMKLCDGPITNEPEFVRLRGITPRGWEGTGKTWDDIPGAGGHITPIARIGHSHPGTKSGHGTINLELHELAHSIDNYITGVYSSYSISSSSNFTDIWMNEVRGILPTEYFMLYREEYFAETFAMYYLSNSTKNELMKNAPRTYNFIMNLENQKVRNLGQENNMDTDNIIIQKEILEY